MTQEERIEKLEKLVEEHRLRTHTLERALEAASRSASQTRRENEEAYRSVKALLGADIQNLRGMLGALAQRFKLVWVTTPAKTEWVKDRGQWF